MEIASTPEAQNTHDICADNGDDIQPNGHGEVEQRIINTPPSSKNLITRDLQNGNDEATEPPSKRRRVSEGVPARSKPKSPPWKKIVAEGPSSFHDETGKRKSGRTNKIPLELQPPSDKRTTRGAIQKDSSAKGRSSLANGYTSTPHQASKNGSKPPGSAGAAASQHSGKSPAKPTVSKRPYHRRSLPAEMNHSPTKPDKKPMTPKHTTSVVTQSNRSARGRRLGYTYLVDDQEPAPVQSTRAADLTNNSPGGKPSKIKFRVKAPPIPRPHPGLILTRPKQNETLQEFFLHNGSVQVEAGGLFDPEDPFEYTEEQIRSDANVIRRAEAAAEPGGVLSSDRCKEYHETDVGDHVPQQWSHRDHMNRAAVKFRQLMLREQREHRQTAKRLAEACRDKWNQRQPKTAEQVEAEQVKASQVRYRLLVKSLQGTWDNVKAEVNRRRLLEWEVQEQARIRKALSEAVDVSTLKLQQRRAHMDSDMASDEGDETSTVGSDMESEEASGSDSHSDDGESNMSSTDSENDENQPRADAAEDEHLTIEQLREKYAALPAPGFAKEGVDSDSVMDQTGIIDDSDESTDMEDDMGSSDEGSAGEDDPSGEEDEDDEYEDDEGAESGLLGFLPRSELMAVDAEEPSITPGQVAEDEDMGDEDEVSFVPDGGQFEDSGDQTVDIVPQVDTELLDETEDVDTEPMTTQMQTTIEVLTGSPDRSSQQTPRTAETRASEADSASSVELQLNSRHVTHSVTPQPSNQLKTAVPFLLRGTLREYQHYGLDWLANLYANNANGILADEMGLGKTIQTISLLAHLACVHEEWGPHLIVVPTSVMLNWEMEFKKFLPGFKIMTYYGTQDERKRKRLGWTSDDKWNVFITSYQLIIKDQAVFKRRQWHYMILDEAHNIKNFQSKRWQTMLTFNTRARLLLTGTPLQNNLTELWSLLYFLMPSDGTPGGGFAGLGEFQEWFGKPGALILEHGREYMDDEARGIIAKLHKILRPYLLRRLKADVEKQMPAKYEHVEYCRLSKRQRELYDGFLNRDDTRGTLASGNYLSIINCLMQLRKVCNHPDLFVDRPITTSFPMQKSAVADFQIQEDLVRRRLLAEHPMTKASLEFLNLVPTRHEHLSDAVTTRSSILSAQRQLMDMRETQRLRAQAAFTTLDPSTAQSNLTYLESASRWGRFEELQHCVYLNALRRQQKPIYGSRLVELLTFGIEQRPFQARPKRRDKMLSWLEDTSPILKDMVKSLNQVSEDLTPVISRFSCVTPVVIAPDIAPLVLGRQGVAAIQSNNDMFKVDPFHEARMRLSIQFPDKRLLQYDCGKLQTLDRLLRKLQAGGHRALIFTQMTKVLDILEQFLNIHGHKYLRLDGSTSIEQRQILTDRFNNDTRILTFILSSRSGGLGINLTGADTVIFYDLDWNPAMDKQCQDRCHRIGQTRDVHIYRLVSEHTIEANILRKANQKRMLDDIVIQEGDFTTDYFNKISPEDETVEDPTLHDGDAAANAAMDRVLGGPQVKRVLAEAEDQEDAVAARQAESEMQTDAADFDENAAAAAVLDASGDVTKSTLDPAGVAAFDNANVEDLDEDEMNAWGQRVNSTDDYMLNLMTEQLKDTPLELPKDKSRSKKGRDHRTHRVR